MSQPATVLFAAIALQVWTAAPGGQGLPLLPGRSGTWVAPANPTQPAPARPAGPGAQPPTVDRPPDSGEEPIGFSDARPPPFPSEDLELSAVLRESVEHNLDLRANAIDVGISETAILSALGAFDVFLSAGINGSISRTPQRGSQFAFSQGSRTVGGFVGFNRKLETGGTIDLRINASRTLTDQSTNFFDPNAEATLLAGYAIQPTLTLTHPLLRGAGLRVNRADINRAKLATSQSEAQRQIIAQDLVRDIVSAYWDVLFALRDLDNKRRSVELATEQLDRTNALVAAGRLAPVDKKAVEQALAARESEVYLAENTLLNNSLTLRTLMGQEFADRDILGIVATTDPTVRPRPIDHRQEIEIALRGHPQIRQLELALASRRIDELEAANQRLPQLDISGTFSPQGRSVDRLATPDAGDPGERGSWGEAFRNFFGEDVAEDGLLADWTLSGSLTLTWDVQNRGPRGNHERSQLEVRKAKLNLKQLRQTLAGSVIRAAHGLRTAGKRMEVATLSVELAQENLAAEKARFEVGRSTNFDVLLRLDELDSAQAEALSAQIGYFQALVQLQALNGEILPAYGLDLP